MHCIICVYVFAFTQVSQWYELVVFTASMEIYGSAVADKLDNNRNILKRRYYRQVLLMNAARLMRRQLYRICDVTMNADIYTVCVIVEHLSLYFRAASVTCVCLFLCAALYVGSR